MRKTQCDQGLVTCKTMREFLFGPVQKTLAVLFEVTLEHEGVSRFIQQRFTLARNVEIHQRQANTRQLQLLAQHMSVDPELSPMELALIVRHFRKIAAERFDLFKPVFNRVIAIRAATNKLMLVFTCQAYFGLVVFRPLRRDLPMSRDAFHCGRPAIKAHVEITFLAVNSHSERTETSYFIRLSNPSSLTLK